MTERSQVSSEYGPEEWKQVCLQSTIRKYTCHPDARLFRAQDPDHNVEPLGNGKYILFHFLMLFNLEWKKEKELEKQLMTLQGAVGAAGHMVTEVLDLCDDLATNLGTTVKEYNNPNEMIEDPRAEAAKIMSGIQKTVFSKVARKQSNMLKLIAGVYNSTLMMCRLVFNTNFYVNKTFVGSGTISWVRSA